MGLIDRQSTGTKNPGCWVYILRCADGTLYTGQAGDLTKRLALHNAGKAARYTRGRVPVDLVYAEWVATRSEALRRERVIRRLPRAAKLDLAGSWRRNDSIGTDILPNPSGTQ